MMKTYSNSKQMTGEKIPGDLNKWDYMGTDPNEILLYKYDVLCQRSTTLFHTHPPVSSAITKTGVYAIGPGLRFRSQPDHEYLGIDSKTAKDWSMRFQKIVHYAFLIMNFYEKQGILFDTAGIMGDSLLLFDRTETENGVPFDLIEVGGDSIDFQAPGDDVTLGIIHDKMLRRKGFIQAENGKRVPFRDANNDQVAIQFFNKTMARQLRGYPTAYNIIAAAKNHDRKWDAMLARAVLEATILGFSQTDGEDTRQQADTLADSVINEDGGSPSTGINESTNLINGAPGSFYNFKSGGSMQFMDMKTPANNFDKLELAYLDMVGMGMDVPREIILSTYGQSFTAHKGTLNDFMKIIKKKRANFVNKVCYPVLFEIAKWAFMENIIEMPAADFFTNPIAQRAVLAGNWLGPVPGHINPKVEADALVIAKDNAFMTPADAAAVYDNEWDDQFEEWAQQMKEWNEASPAKQGSILQEQEEELNNSDDDTDEEPAEPEPDEKKPTEEDE